MKATRLLVKEFGVGLHSSELNGVHLDPIRCINAKFIITLMDDQEVSNDVEGRIAYHPRAQSYRIVLFFGGRDPNYYYHEMPKYIGWLTKDNLFIDEQYDNGCDNTIVDAIQHYSRTIADQFERDLSQFKKESQRVGIPLKTISFSEPTLCEINYRRKRDIRKKLEKSGLLGAAD